MPLDFSKETPEPTLGRVRRPRDVDERYDWPRRVIKAGLRDEGGPWVVLYENQRKQIERYKGQYDREGAGKSRQPAPEGYVWSENVLANAYSVTDESIWKRNSSSGPDSILSEEQISYVIQELRSGVNVVEVSSGDGAVASFRYNHETMSYAVYAHRGNRYVKYQMASLDVNDLGYDAAIRFVIKYVSMKLRETEREQGEA